MIGIALSIFIGVGIGYFLKNDFITSNSSLLIDIGLCLLLFFVGIDIGNNSSAFSKLKYHGKKIIFIPTATVVGSLIGGALASFVLPVSVGEGIAIASGLGWYSLSAVELAKISAELGSLAFLCNVFREVIAILIIPIISKKFGAFEAISTAGATAMDTLLPIINKNNSPNISVVSFFSGATLTATIPILIPIIVTIFNL